MFDEVTNLVTYSPIVLQSFFLSRRILREFWGIIKTNMDDSCVAMKGWAILICVSADGDDQIERHFQQSADKLG